MNKVIVITGPTAVGKTKLSIEVAKTLNTEIINGDAYQIYKYMNIGTSKPTIENRCGIKHHLMDFLDPLSSFSICDYQKLVREKIADFHQNNLVPIITGGSGLYIDSVLYDYRFAENARNECLEKEYQNLSNTELHKILEGIDLEASIKIHPNNRKRVLRAIELGNSSIAKDERSYKDKPLYDFLLIFLNDERSALYERINRRVDEMMNMGLLEEVKKLYPNKLSTQASKAIGYQELFPYLEGQITLEEATNLIKQHTRNYAKRQMTWYRNNPHVNIIMIDKDNLDNTKEELLKIVNEFLSK